MNQTQVLDRTPVVETAFPEYLRQISEYEDTDIMRARLLLLFIWDLLREIIWDPIEIEDLERVFSDDGSLMRLINESENNSELFLSRRPRRNNELRRLHYTAQSDVASVST